MPKKKGTDKAAEEKKSVEETQAPVEGKEKVEKEEKPVEEVSEKEKEASKTTGEKASVEETQAPVEEREGVVKKEEKVEKGKKPVEEVSEKKEVSPKVSEVLKEVKTMTPEERTEFGVSMVKGLNVLELSEWVKTLEKEFGISATAPVAVAAAPAGGQAPSASAEEAKKDSFTVMLTSSGDKKIQVIKEVRTITNLGLREAKALVDSAPKPVKENVTEQEASEIKAKLEAAGATVELK